MVGRTWKKMTPADQTSTFDEILGGDVPISKHSGGRYQYVPAPWYRGTSLIRKRPPPYHHRRTLGIDLLYGPGREVFLMICPREGWGGGVIAREKECERALLIQVPISKHSGGRCQCVPAPCRRDRESVVNSEIQRGRC